MSTTLPTKPIERARITVQGDPSVGIPHGNFSMTLYWDPACVADPVSELGAMRLLIGALYHTMSGESVTVTFDYELEARATAELERVFGDGGATAELLDMIDEGQKRAQEKPLRLD